ncbi:DegT/DnrJ/EryC1/StrS family aminotransferase [Ornithinimicrobium pratense]|uniref:Aminotransferase class I/II-fold pyridoxal phosphate-dependent enzyme n=1 Tax=Ornithinimicrobium pratense TaxID=2593973 RepID=A0A5J6V8S4_9MICO|nr:aminotransferase class I/II-fold pyridoxal phosphate-dependent enzyme [Ornithinimicrobium pratense]QFG69754.1 aminotransferase class I/II-fold pyridoxal phosphate-dependent enzyme [Ornithinimicrobium pratense]
MSERIHLSKADVTEVEERYVLNALRSGWVAPLGPDVDAFEQEIARRVGVPHALALSSGTAALHLALLHLGAGPGTTVVLPTLTFAATANAAAYTGADLFFVDSNPVDGNIDVELLEDSLDLLQGQGRSVAAVMTVDLFGRPCDYDSLVPAVSARGIPIIEDAAEALGTVLDGKQAGSFGTAAALSFNGNKIMTTSGGGMLLSSDSHLMEHVRKLSTQSREPVPWYEHAEIGYNYRLSNLLAALGRGQLTRLDTMVKRRRGIRARYMHLLQDIKDLTFLGSRDSRLHVEQNDWLTVVCLPSHLQGKTNAVITDLNQMGVEARHVWKPMHMQPVFSSCPSLLSGVAERLFETGIALPSGSALTDEQIDEVARAFHVVLGAWSYQ